MAQAVKNLPAMQETRVQILHQEETLEKEMAIHSSIPAWTIPWTEEPGRLESVGSQELDMTEWPNHHHQKILQHLPLTKDSHSEHRQYGYKPVKTNLDRQATRGGSQTISKIGNSASNHESSEKRK